METHHQEGTDLQNQPHLSKLPLRFLNLQLNQLQHPLLHLLLPLLPLPSQRLPLHLLLSLQLPQHLLPHRLRLLQLVNLSMYLRHPTTLLRASCPR